MLIDITIHDLVFMSQCFIWIYMDLYGFILNLYGFIEKVKLISTMLFFLCFIQCYDSYLGIGIHFTSNY